MVSLQLKKLRGLVIAGGTNYEQFPIYLKDLHRPMDAAIQDLRSQVVREACITLAYLSQQLKNKFASFGENLLPALMNLIQNSAKVCTYTRTLISFSFHFFQRA